MEISFLQSGSVRVKISESTPRWQVGIVLITCIIFHANYIVAFVVSAGGFIGCNQFRPESNRCCYIDGRFAIAMEEFRKIHVFMF